MSIAALSAKRCKVCNQRIAGPHVITDAPICLDCFDHADWSDVEAKPTTPLIYLWKDASTRTRHPRHQEERPMRTREYIGCPVVTHIGHVGANGAMICETCSGAFPVVQEELV